MLTFFHTNQEYDLSVVICGVLGMVMIVVCWLISVVSIVYGFFKLCKPNISQNVRYQIMARHVFSIVFFVLSQFYLQIGTFIIFLPGYYSSGTPPDYNDDRWARALKIIYATQGFTLPLTRLGEPYFYRIVLQKLKILICFCGSEERRKQAEREEMLNDQTFMQRNLLDISDHFE